MFRSRKYIYRTGRRYKRRRWVSRKTRSNRIFRKFISRKALRPELKYIDTLIDNTLAAGSNFNIQITPSSITSGTGRSNRIGQSLKFIKIDMRAYIRNDSSTTGGLAPTDASFITRVILWTPRVDHDAAAAAMTATDFNGIIDVNTFTVYRDFVVTLMPPFMADDLSDAVPSGNGRDRILKKVSLKFPRKVHFSTTSSIVDEEKYSCYCTLKTQGPIAYNLYVRTWFIDA